MRTPLAPRGKPARAAAGAPAKASRPPGPMTATVSQSASELVAIGQDEESRTLTQAVKWFAESRVLRDGARTIIFK